MKTKPLRTIAVIAFAIAILGGATWAMRRISAVRSEALKQQAVRALDNAMAVRTARVGRTDIGNTLTFNGDIEAMRTVQLQPKVAGRLLSLELEDGTPVEEGVRVGKGVRLAQLDDRECHAQLSSAKAARSAAAATLEVSRAALAQKKAARLASQAATASSQANYDDKERELKRQESLVSRNASTSQNLDLARTAFAQAGAELKRCQADESAAQAAVLSAEAAISQSEAALEQSEAKLEEAQLNFDETRLYSPMDGVVSVKHVDPGAMVGVGTAIVTIVSMDTVKVLLSVPVNHLSKVVPGQTRAVLRADTIPGQAIECRIDRIYPSVDPSTRTAKVELRLPNPREGGAGPHLLRDGMFASVDLLLEDHRNAVAIGQDLPVRVLDKHIVYVCDGDQVRAVPVELGLRSGGLVEVLSGLDEGDEIVVQGSHRLTDGSRIHRIGDDGSQEGGK